MIRHLRHGFDCLVIVEAVSLFCSRFDAGALHDNEADTSPRIGIEEPLRFFGDGVAPRPPELETRGGLDDPVPGRDPADTGGLQELVNFWSDISDYPPASQSFSEQRMPRGSYGSPGTLLLSASFYR